MDASDVIESYVHDVARRLPPSKRNDVAFELRALLNEDLEALAEEQGRRPDNDMAVGMLRQLGRPSETAIRYYQPFTIIRPSDTWSFLVATVAGTILISLVAPSSDAANIAGLSWLGLLVIVFGIRSFILRRRPDAFAWKPGPVRDVDAISRPRAVALAALSLAALVLYLAPGPVLDAVAGRWIDADRIEYSDSFTHPLRIQWLAGALVVVAGLQLVIATRRRWHLWLRLLRLAVGIVIGVQLGWHSRYGDVMTDPEIDDLAIAVMALGSAVIMVSALIGLYREWTRIRPSPSTAPPAQAAATPSPAH
jgi:uncharacterized membrane protein